MMKKTKQAPVSPQAHPQPPQPVRWKGKQIYSVHDIDEILKVLGRKVEDRNQFTVELSLIANRFLSEKPFVAPLSRMQHLTNLDEFIQLLQTIICLGKYRSELIADLVDFPMRSTREEAGAAFSGLQGGAAILLGEAVILRREIIDTKPERGGTPTGSARDPFIKRMVRELLVLYREYRSEAPTMDGQVDKRVFRFVRACIIPLEEHTKREIVVLDKRGMSRSLNSMVIDVLTKDGWMKKGPATKETKEHESDYIKYLRRKYSKLRTSK